jgi:hypothetical protein
VLRLKPTVVGGAQRPKRPHFNHENILGSRSRCLYGARLGERNGFSDWARRAGKQGWTTEVPPACTRNGLKSTAVIAGDAAVARPFRRPVMGSN